MLIFTCFFAIYGVAFIENFYDNEDFDLSTEPKYKYPPIPQLGEWVSKLSESLLNSFYERSATSNNYIYQLVKGRRGMSAAKAGHISQAMRELDEAHNGVPEPLTRGDLCEACRACEYYKAREDS